MAGVRMRARNGAVVVVDEATAAALSGAWWARLSGPAPVRAPAPAASTLAEAAPRLDGPAPEGAPKPYASRGDWAAYAESVGVEPGDMTKAQIQSAIANL